MYNELRHDAAAELCRKYDKETVREILDILDRVSVNYDIRHSDLSLVPYSNRAPEIVEKYIACKTVEGYSKGTLENYFLTYKSFFNIVRKPIGEINADDIRKYLFFVENERHISRTTLDKYRQHLSSLFTWLCDEEYIDKNPCSAIHRIKGESKPRRALDESDIEYLRMACRTKRERAVIEILLSTGARVSEIANMNIEDIDWGNRSARVFGKNSEYYTVRFKPKTEIALKEYLSARTDSNNAVFVTQKSPYSRISSGDIRRIINRIKGRTKITKPVTPHVFRHTMATVAVANGAKIQNVQKMLNHKNINTTMIYAETCVRDVVNDYEKCVNI